MNKKLSTSNIVNIIILMCILAAMVSIAIMQVIRTTQDISHVGAKVYIVGVSVVVVAAIIPVILIILVKFLKKDL
jgi:hypothetical protein